MTRPFETSSQSGREVAASIVVITKMKGGLVASLSTASLPVSTGASMPENTALSCHECNEKKGPNIAGVDPNDGEVARLFNPRTQKWSDHFDFRGPNIVGLTPTGRATVQTLGMNEEDRVLLRAELGYPHTLRDEQ